MSKQRQELLTLFGRSGEDAAGDARADKDETQNGPSRKLFVSQLFRNLDVHLNDWGTGFNRPFSVGLYANGKTLSRHSTESPDEIRITANGRVLADIRAVYTYGKGVHFEYDVPSDKKFKPLVVDGKPMTIGAGQIELSDSTMAGFSTWLVEKLGPTADLSSSPAPRHHK